MATRAEQGSSSVLTTTVLFAVIVGLLYWASDIFIPLALAMLLAFILGPVVNALRGWRLGRIASVGVAVGASGLIVASLAWLISWQLAALVQELPKHREDIRAKISALRAWIEPAPGGQLDQLIQEINYVFQSPSPAGPSATAPMPVVIESRKPMWLTHLESFVSPATELAAQGALSFLLVIFLLLGRENLRSRVIRLIGPDRIATTTKAVDDAANRISRFLRAQLLINCSFGAVLAIALLVVQVKFALLWGFLAAILRYVPYIGTWIGVITPLIVSVALSEGWHQPIAVLIIYAVMEIITSGFVEPYRLSKSLGLSEVAQVLAAAFWAFLWGPIGLILSGPLTACLLVLGKNVPQLRSLDVLLGDEEVLPPAQALFQRLAARDRDEAVAIVDVYLKDHTTEQTLNELLIPVLASAQTAGNRGDLDDADVKWTVRAVRQIADDILELPEQIEANGNALRLRVVMIPADGACDQLALELLARQMPRAAWEMVSLNDSALASELVATARSLKPHAILVMALAVGGLPHLRYLCKRLRSASADVKIFVCQWNKSPGDQRDAPALTEVGADETTTDLATTIQMLKSWQGVFVHQERESQTNSSSANPGNLARHLHHEKLSQEVMPGRQ